MPPLLDIGQSEGRTACKHTALDKFSGQVAGAASCMQHVDSIVFIDACAGDGRPSLFSGTSSPQTIAKHLCWLESKDRKVKGYLIEANRHTFMQLESSITSLSGRTGFERLPEIVTLIHGDYRSKEVAARIDVPTDGTVTFLHIDPNHVDDVELSPFMRSRLSKWTTGLVTLGCNANGIKRLPSAERRKWFDRLEYLLGLLQPYHDACLIRLERDDGQWAYLLSVPRKWRDRTEPTIRSLGKFWPKGITRFWFSEGTLLAAAKELFLTKAEINIMGQLPLL